MGYTVPNDLPRKGNERMVIPMKKMLAMLLAVLTLCFGAAAMVILLVGLFKGPYRKQYLALRAEEKQQKALGTSEE